MRREPWKLKDVVMMAILGVLFAVVYMAVFYGGTAISVALTPLGLSAFGFELIYGVWFMAATITAYIIRKPARPSSPRCWPPPSSCSWATPAAPPWCSPASSRASGASWASPYSATGSTTCSPWPCPASFRRVHLLLRAVLPELLSAGPHHAGRPVGRPALPAPWSSPASSPSWPATAWPGRGYCAATPWAPGLPRYPSTMRRNKQWVN